MACLRIIVTLLPQRPSSSKVASFEGADLTGLSLGVCVTMAGWEEKACSSRQKTALVGCVGRFCVTDKEGSKHCSVGGR